MKCRSRIDENSVNEYEQSVMIDGLISGDDSLGSNNKDEMIKEFLRKNFLKFYINIYKDQSSPILSSSSRSSVHSGGAGSGNGAHSSKNLEDSTAARYMLDIHLFKGTVYVFMDFVRKFMHVMSASCSMCSGSSCCSSSNHSSFLDSQSNNRYSAQHHHDYKLKIFAWLIFIIININYNISQIYL